MTSITIPAFVVWFLIVTIVWYAIGYVINNTLLNWHLHRYLRAHKTGTVPDRYMNAGYIIAGPVGWAAWLYDIIYYQRRKRARARERD